jgi:hypothetical protein
MIVFGSEIITELFAVNIMNRILNVMNLVFFCNVQHDVAIIPIL